MNGQLAPLSNPASPHIRHQIKKTHPAVWLRFKLDLHSEMRGCEIDWMQAAVHQITRDALMFQMSLL